MVMSSKWIIGFLFSEEGDNVGNKIEFWNYRAAIFIRISNYTVKWIIRPPVFYTQNNSVIPNWELPAGGGDK